VGEGAWLTGNHPGEASGKTSVQTIADGRSRDCKRLQIIRVMLLTLLRNLGNHEAVDPFDAD
jgi:hypothetical protein